MPKDRERWERDLYALMCDMQRANGDHTDDVEALVRIAWKLLYDDLKSNSHILNDS